MLTSLTKRPAAVDHRNHAAGRRGGILLSPTVDRLTRSILEGEYDIGERLPTEAQLQEELGVSRSVVREAMKILSSRGLVRIEQGRGTFVCVPNTHPINEQFSLVLRRNAAAAASSCAASGDGNEAGGETGADDFAHLMDVRRVLEIAVAERAAQFSEESDQAEMAAAIAAMRAHPEDAAISAAADARFHVALARSSRNPLWPAILGSLVDLLRRLQETGHHGRDNALMTADQHERILNAVIARDSAAAAAAMKRHLATSDRDLAAARAGITPDDGSATSPEP